MPALSRRSLVAALALVPILRAVPGRAEEGGATVEIDNFVFTPRELTVKPETIVTWKNEDDIPHTIVGKSQQFRSKPLDTGNEFSFTFANPGRFDYFCGLHPHMVGAIIVVA
ncbi:MAG: cupredoxin family copper-binding protein [Beijerinckiaceae bacterium]